MRDPGALLLNDALVERASDCGGACVRSVNYSPLARFLSITNLKSVLKSTGVTSVYFISCRDSDLADVAPKDIKSPAVRDCSD